MSRLICPNRTIRLDQDAKLARGLVGWWPVGNRLSWGTGTLRDCSLNHNDGTLTVGGGDTVTSKWQLTSRAGLRTDGVNDYVPCGDVLNLTGDRTFLLWVKSTNLYLSSTHATFVSKWGPGLSYIFWAHSDAIKFGDSNSNELVWAGGEAVVEDGYWHRLGAVWRSGVGEIYCDSTLRASGGTFTHTSGVGTPFLIGAYSLGGSGLLSADLDDIRAYSRALTPAEVMKDFRETWDGGYGSLEWRRRLWPVAVAAAGQPTMRRWGGMPYMTPGPVLAGRSW